jgi:hypothetical protein
MLKCPFCHFENEDGALFCEQCKSDLGLAEPAVASEIAPGTGGAAPQEGIAITAMPEPIMPLAADIIMTEPRIVETIPLAEASGTEHAHAADEAQLAYPFADSVPVASPVAEAETDSPPAAVPVATPVHGEADKTATGTTTQTDHAAASAAAATGTPLPPGSKPKLVVLRGQRVNTEYPLYEGDNYIGRADEEPVDVDLEDQEPPERIWSSRQHALITFEDGLLAIEDLNSTNGTFVNRTRVHPSQKRSLQVNDIIQIGTVQMKVKI